jgi:hypothetical protein
MGPPDWRGTIVSRSGVIGNRESAIDNRKTIGNRQTIGNPRETACPV